MSPMSHTHIGGNLRPVLQNLILWTRRTTQAYNHFVREDYTRRPTNLVREDYTQRPTNLVREDYTRRPTNLVREDYTHTNMIHAHTCIVHKHTL